MKIKLEQLLQVSRLLSSWGSEQKKFNSKLAYKMMRMINEIKPYFEDFEKSRVALVESLGKPVVADGVETKERAIDQSDQETIKHFQEEMQDLLSAEIEIVFPVGSITMEDLSFETSVADMLILDAVIEK